MTDSGEKHRAYGFFLKIQRENSERRTSGREKSVFFEKIRKKEESAMSKKKKEKDLPRRGGETEDFERSVLPFMKEAEILRTGMEAARQGREDVLAAALSTGRLALNARSNGMSLFLQACAGGHARLVEALGEMGADKNAKNGEMGAMEYASGVRSEETMGVLKRMGLRPGAKTFEQAVRNEKSFEIFKKLFGLNEETEDGRGLMHFAARLGLTEVCRFLARKGSDPMRRDASGDNGLSLLRAAGAESAGVVADFAGVPGAKERERRLALKWDTRRVDAVIDSLFRMSERAWPEALGKGGLWEGWSRDATEAGVTSVLVSSAFEGALGRVLEVFDPKKRGEAQTSARLLAEQTTNAASFLRTKRIFVFEGEALPTPTDCYPREILAALPYSSMALVWRSGMVDRGAMISRDGSRIRCTLLVTDKGGREMATTMVMDAGADNGMEKMDAACERAAKKSVLALSNLSVGEKDRESLMKSWPVRAKALERVMSLAAWVCSAAAEARPTGTAQREESSEEPSEERRTRCREA